MTTLYAIVGKDGKAHAACYDRATLMDDWLELTGAEFNETNFPELSLVQLHTYDPEREGVYSLENQVVLAKDLHARFSEMVEFAVQNADSDTVMEYGEGGYIHIDECNTFLSAGKEKP